MAGWAGGHSFAHEHGCHSIREDSKINYATGNIFCMFHGGFCTKTFLEFWQQIKVSRGEIVGKALSVRKNIIGNPNLLAR